MGKTTGIHQMEMKPEPGWHNLTVLDNSGNLLSKNIMIVNGRS
jgi:hypothetical protein